MATGRKVYDGTDTWVAQDAATHPSYIPATVAAYSVNRQYRGGINRTRPPFTELTLQVEQGQEESILSDFITGNFQGAYPYQSIKVDASDGVAVAVAGKIYFLRIVNNNAFLSLLIDGNDPDLMHTWFVQAGDLLYIQNGYQNAIMWNGVDPATRLNPAAGEMPTGTIMAYYAGRVWVSDKNNNIYAGDIEFGNGFTDYSNTKNFTEGTYWAEGGSFTPPARLGNITGMSVLPSINLNDRGQGELVVYCQSGAFTLNGIVPRSQWIDTNIQKVSLYGRGCVSPWSICGVNNEVFFRSDDGWSLYSNAQLDFNQRLSFRKLSREVNQWVDQDTPWMRQFASAMFFDNRLIATVSPYTVTSERGINRPHRAMIVLDLDQTASAAPDSQINFRWNGLWEGPQPVQLLTAQINGEQRAFCFSYDSDGVNRLYELQTAGVDDIGNGQSVKVKSFFTTKRFSFGDASQKFERKELNGGEMWVSELAEESMMNVQYRGDSYPCWNDLMPEAIAGCDDCDTEYTNCEWDVSQHRYRQIKFTTPDPDTCQVGSDFKAVKGAEFQLKISLEGAATVDRLRISASMNTDENTIGECVGEMATDPARCEVIDCCPVHTLNFYRIV